MYGYWNCECPKCHHTDKLRGEDTQPQTWRPTCTNPSCRHGHVEFTHGNPSVGMAFTGFTHDEASELAVGA